MKKCISALLALILVFSLAACSVSAKTPSKAVSKSDNRTLYTYTTSNSGKKITVKEVNLPISKDWIKWDVAICTNHYIYPFFDMSDKKLMPVYAMYELQAYFGDGIILAISPQVRKGSVRSIDIPYTDYYDAGEKSVIHYTFNVSKNKITVNNGNSTESVQFDNSGNVIKINSDSTYKFTYKNNKLTKISGEYLPTPTINSKGEITSMQTGGTLSNTIVSYKYNSNGIIKECDYYYGFGDATSGCQMNIKKNYEVEDGVINEIVFTGKLNTREEIDPATSDEQIKHNYTLNLNEQYIYEN